MDYKAKIHQYWPEFAQNGKENITVEMLLSHQVWGSDVHAWEKHAEKTYGRERERECVCVCVCVCLCLCLCVCLCLCWSV